MKAQDKVLQVYPEAVCIREAGTFAGGVTRFSVLPRPNARQSLAMDNQERRAWAEAWRAIERAGVPIKCPYCKAKLTPFEGDEDGPVTAWAHPKRSNGCRWSEWEGITKRQIAAAAARQPKDGARS